ncbi:MAG: 5-(carboxyamino)imidazole ribonucleotide synthase, partial [Acidimicrobiia bacterium]
MTSPIVPPATIGMLGGGQLGRYALMAARTMGYRTMVLEPDPLAPAGRVADEHVVAAYDDERALDHLARACDVVTTEFENPPAAALEYLARRTFVAPSPDAVAVAQDRIVEKAFLERAGLPVGPYAVIEGADADPAIAYPAILKTA